MICSCIHDQDSYKKLHESVAKAATVILWTGMSEWVDP